MTLPPIHPNSLGSVLEWALAAAGRFDEGERMFAPEKPKYRNHAQIEAEKEMGE